MSSGILVDFVILYMKNALLVVKNSLLTELMIKKNCLTIDSDLLAKKPLRIDGIWRRMADSMPFHRGH